MDLDSFSPCGITLDDLMEILDLEPFLIVVLKDYTNKQFQKDFGFSKKTAKKAMKIYNNVLNLYDFYGTKIPGFLYRFDMQYIEYITFKRTQTILSGLKAR